MNLKKLERTAYVKIILSEPVFTVKSDIINEL